MRPPLLLHAEATDDRTQTITLIGELDSHAVPMLRAAAEQSGRDQLVVDARHASFVDAAAVDALLALNTDRPLRIALSAPLRDVLAVTGADRSLDCYIDAAPPRLDGAPFGVGVHDQHLRYLYVNPALASINGLTASEHIGQTPIDLFDSGVDEVTPVMREVIVSGCASSLGVIGSTPAKVDSAWAVSFYPSFPLDGSRHVVAVVRNDDIDQRHADNPSASLTFTTNCGCGCG